MLPIVSIPEVKRVWLPAALWKTALSITVNTGATQKVTPVPITTSPSNLSASGVLLLLLLLLLSLRWRIRGCVREMEIWGTWCIHTYGLSCLCCIMCTTLSAGNNGSYDDDCSHFVLLVKEEDIVTCGGLLFAKKRNLWANFVKLYGCPSNVGSNFLGLKEFVVFP